MRVLTVIGVILSLGLAPSVPAAVVSDGSRPLLCALIEVTEYEVAGECHRVTPEVVNLSRFLNVNIQEKVLSGTDASSRTTPIGTLHHADGRVILHGGQNGRGWSAVIVQDTGHLSATVADDGSAFVIFGACTTP